MIGIPDHLNCKTFVLRAGFLEAQVPFKAGFTLSHIKPLNAELNPFCHLLALLGPLHILHVGRIRVNN